MSLSRPTETTQLVTPSDATIEIDRTNDSNSSNLTLDQLNEKLDQLTRESWKCFGLKLTVPLIPLLLTGGAVISLNSYFTKNPGKDKEEEDMNVEAVSATLLAGTMGFFGTVFCYSKDKHEQQKGIDKEIESIKHQIATRRM